MRSIPTFSHLLGWLRSRRRAAWLGGACVLLAVALAFPRTGAGGVALLLLVACGGALIAAGSLRFPLTLSRSASDALIVVSVLAGGVVLFHDSWSVSSLNTYDWAPHHALLQHLVESLQRGGVPRYVQGVSTGDSPYELYPLLPYYLLAKAAILTRSSDLPLLLARAAMVTHVLAALGAALLTRRVLAWPFALLVGFVTLFDVGSAFGGGADGLLGLGVVHGAVANTAWSFVLAAVLDALARPRLLTSVRLWLLVAFAVSCHPLGLLSALATSLALVLVALLARDVTPRRALFCILHVGLGVALAGVAWMPLGERLVTYGVHFSLGGQLAWEAFGHLLGTSIPEATVGPLVFAGYLGVVVGILSRRAAPTLLACFVAILAAGLFDQLYTLLHLVPSLEGSRFQTVRLASACKSSVYVLGALVLELALTQVRPRKIDVGWLTAGALLALGAAGGLRGGVPYFDRLGSTIRGLVHRDVPDAAGLRALSAWAKEQHAAMTPDRFGRLLHEDDRRFFSVFHVNALSGFPSLWLGSVPCLFLRERMEDASPESLRRFNVQWVMHRDGPPSLGDPATEKRFGRYFVRELPTFDGHFARVERGAGRATVTRLEDDVVEVELTETTQPALVTLGMGYYPRWEAEHQSRGRLPVYAVPSVPGAKLRVVGAWLPPGRTTFRTSGRLPSDGRGTWLSIAAVLVAVGAAGAWSSARTRHIALRGLARLTRSFVRHRARLARGAFACAALAVLVLGWWSSRAAAAALGVGNGLVGGARVQSRGRDGKWRDCLYSPLHGAYRCAGPLLVQDSVADLLEDAPPSWPFSVPAIVVATSTRDADVRLRLGARLEGEYWAATSGPEVRLSTSDSVHVTLGAAQQSLSFERTAEPREVTLEAHVPAGQTLKVAVVRRDRLDPDRHYPSAPDLSPLP